MNVSFKVIFFLGSFQLVASAPEQVVPTQVTDGEQVLTELQQAREQRKLSDAENIKLREKCFLYSQLCEANKQYRKHLKSLNELVTHIGQVRELPDEVFSEEGLAQQEHYCVRSGFRRKLARRMSESDSKVA